MRILSDDAITDFRDHGVGKRALVMIHLTNANGLRVFASQAVEEGLIAASSGRAFADGTWLADGSVKAGADSPEILGRHDWLLDAGQTTQGKFSGADPFASFIENEISSLSFTVSNEPDADGHHRMTRILAQEPMINAKVDIRAGFSGRTVADVVTLGSYVVRRIRERKEAVTFECEAA